MTRFARAVLLAPLLVSSFFLGCGGQKAFVRVDTPPKRTWEDQIWFGNVKRELTLRWNIEPTELKSVPIVFQSKGRIVVAKRGPDLIPIFFNQQPDNQRGSTRYDTGFEKQISEGMTKSAWYLHAISAAPEASSIVLDLMFLPEQLYEKPEHCLKASELLTAARVAVNKAELTRLKQELELCERIQVDCLGFRAEAEEVASILRAEIDRHYCDQIRELTEKEHCSEALQVLGELSPNSPWYEKAQALMGDCKERAAAAAEVRRRKREAACKEARPELRNAQTEFEAGNYKKAYQLAIGISGDCPEVKKQARVLAEKAKEELTKAACAPARKRLSEAQALLEATKYEKAIQLASNIDEACPEIEKARGLIRQAKGKMEERSAFRKVVSLTSEGKCGEARRYLYKLQDDVYREAEGMIRRCDNPYETLGALSLSITDTGQRIGNSIYKKNAQWHSSGQNCFMVRIRDRGDVAIWCDTAFRIALIEPTALKVECKVDEPRKGELKTKCILMNVAPNTILKFQVEKSGARNADMEYDMELHLYPN